MTWLFVKEPTQGFFQKPTWKRCFATLRENRFRVYILPSPGSVEENEPKQRVGLAKAVVDVEPEQQGAGSRCSGIRLCFQSQQDKEASEKGRHHFSSLYLLPPSPELKKKLVDTLGCYCTVVKSKSVAQIHELLTSGSESESATATTEQAAFQSIVESSAVAKHAARSDGFFAHLFQQSHDSLGWNSKEHLRPFLFVIGRDGVLLQYEVSLFACVEVGSGTRVMKEVQEKFSPGESDRKFAFTVHGPLSEAGPHSPFHKSRPASTRRHRRKGSVCSVNITLAAASDEERERRTTEITRYIRWCELQRLDSTKRRSRCLEITAKDWLFVKEPKVFARWMRRFCVLFVSERSKELVFYKSDVEGQQVGSVDLANVPNDDIVQVPVDVEGTTCMMIEISQGRKRWLIRNIPDVSADLDTWHFHLKTSATTQTIQKQQNLREPEHEKSRLRRSSSDSRLLRSRQLDDGDAGFEDNGEFSGVLRGDTRKRRSSSALFSPTRGSFLASKDDVVSLSKWEVLSGNVPKECLSFSPYAATILAESLCSD